MDQVLKTHQEMDLSGSYLDTVTHTPKMKNMHRYTESLPSLRATDQIPENPLHLKMCAPLLPTKFLVNVRPKAQQIQPEVSRSNSKPTASSSYQMNQRILSLLRQKNKSEKESQVSKLHTVMDHPQQSRRILAKDARSKMSTQQRMENSSRRLEVHLSMQLQSSNISRVIEPSNRAEQFQIESPLHRHSITELYKKNSSESKIPPLMGRQSMPRDSTRAATGEQDSFGMNTSTLNSPLYLKPKYTPRKPI